MIFLDPLERVVRVVIALAILATVIGCAVIGAVWSPVVAAYIIGGVTLGPALVILMRTIEAWRLSRRIVVIGRDVPAARLVSRLPSKSQRKAWARERA